MVRCAIYTRKSTEEGLEQEFNSLDAQRESAKVFIASQGWTALPDRYDDGGFSGGNIERPGPVAKSILPSALKSAAARENGYAPVPEV